ncbi:hypothetical protein CNR22_16320 [Sphingobacteriaceae bacterium]|nr:hypothetical protein CNR22_16320 [Sphingobacteriaceae bacterium]
MASFKELYGKHKLLVPLILLLFLCIQLLVQSWQGIIESEGSSYLFSLTTRHYYAFAAVCINFIIYFALRSFYKYSLVITFFLAIFNFIDVVAMPVNTSWNVGSMNLSFEPTCFYLFLVFLFLNVDLPKISKSKSQEKYSFNYKRTKTEIEVDKYKNLYKHKSTEQLEKILTNETIRETAREALQQTLAERQQNANEASK